MKQLHPQQLHHYQVRAINHALEHPRAFLWLDMGLGKTIVVLSAIRHLMRHNAIRAVLVVGPLRVVESVWRHEAAKWTHTQDLTFSLIHGDPQARMRALIRQADIYLINYENLVWLSTQLRHYYLRQKVPLPFDMLVLDESTRMKSIETKRFKAAVPLLPSLKRRVGLTGTPSSNGLEDLFGQFLMIDDGNRLGTNKHMFLNSFFAPVGYNGYKYEPTKEGEAYIHKQVSDIVLEMKGEDYLELPKLIVNDLAVDLKPEHRAQYEKLEREFFTELDTGATLEVANAAAKTTKLLQMANGAAITDSETGAWEPVHDAKLDALEEVLEEAGGNPVLVGYNYRADAARILKRFKKLAPRNLTGMSAKDFNQTLVDWGQGRVRLLLGHPASMGHGVDRLQHTGNVMVWFGPNWSLELTLQFNARLHRQGQTKPVICHRILTKGTMDEAVIMALSKKHQTQDDLRCAVNEYRKRKEASNQ